MFSRKLILLVFLAIITFGCAAFQHGYTTSRYVGVLMPASTQRGAERLKMEREFDKTIASVIDTVGQPDYLFVESTNKVELFYIDKDLVYSFQRTWTSNSKLSVSKGISENYALQLRPEDQKRLQAVRGILTSPAIDTKMDNSSSAQKEAPISASPSQKQESASPPNPTQNTLTNSTNTNSPKKVETPPLDLFSPF